MTGVSGNAVPDEVRKRPQDHQRKPPVQSKPVGLARVTYLSDQQVVCSCGWGTSHIRPKVLEDGIDRHLNRKHNGRGIRL